MDRLADETEREQDSQQPPERSAESAAAAPTAPTVEDWWRELARDIQKQIQQASAPLDFEGEGKQVYRVSNTRAKITLEAEFDPEARNVRFDYSSQAEPPREISPGATRQPRGLAPEGGILSLRPRQDGIAVFYSDQELGRDQVLSTLLEPVLSAEPPSEQAA